MAQISFHPATKENQLKILDALGNAAISTHPVYYHRKIVDGDTVKLVWLDPQDVVVGGVTLSEWKDTVIVKKQGSAPTSIEDGTIVAVNAVRNAHGSEETAYVDEQAGGVSWHYRAFPRSTNGAVNMSGDNIFQTYVLFGFCIDEANPSETDSVSYIEGNESFTPASMDFANNVFDYGSWGDAFFLANLKPCMLHYPDATHDSEYVDYYLDPDDLTKKLDGTPSDVANLDYPGNAMVEWGVPVFYRAYKSGSKLYCLFSDEKVDSSFECFSALKEDGTYGRFYLPIYEGTFTNSTTATNYVKGVTKMRSMSCGYPANALINSAGTKAILNSTSTQEFEASQLNGGGWTVTRWADEELVRLLSILLFKRLDFQSALTGTYPTGSALVLNCGEGNDKGLFWGKGDGSTTVSKTFGMENCFGHRNRRPTGIAVINGEVYTKMTKHTGDGSMGANFVYSDSQSDYTRNYVKTGKFVGAGSAASYITTMLGKTEFDGEKRTSCVLIPETSGGGGSAIHYCDAAYLSGGVRGVLLGGAVANGAAAGLFYFNANSAPSASYWSCGASLSYRNF